MDINTCVATTAPFTTIALYSHVVPAVLTLFLGLYLLFKTKFSFSSKVFFLFTTMFSLWLVGDLVTWTSPVYNWVIFNWSQLDNINIIFFALAAYFFSVTIREKDINTFQKIFLAALTLPGFYITFKLGTVQNFDQAFCNVSNSDFLTYYKLIQEFICVGYIMIEGAIMYIEHKEKRSQVLVIGTAFVLFLSIFGVTEFLASEYGGTAYTTSLYGLFVLPVFLALIIISIVRYKMFEIKNIVTQLLVYVLIILVATQFLFLENSTNKILNSITLLLSVCFGYLLIKNIKQERVYIQNIENLASNLEHANTRLKELDQQKSEFVSLASHQLRGPLAAIKGYASMLIEGDVGELTKEVKDVIETIYKSTQALVVIVGDYLDVSRIEQGTMKYDFVDFDVKTLAETVITEMKPNIKIEELKLSFEAEPADYMINADQGKIKQVFSNLIDNSIKYTKKGAINVSLKRTGDTIRFAVKDNGVGILPEVLPRLFEKFTRAPDASKTNIMGTGLGLYVAKKMIEAHHGRIWAESPGKDKGSTFNVELEALHKGTAAIQPPKPPESKIEKFAKEL